MGIMIWQIKKMKNVGEETASRDVITKHRIDTAMIDKHMIITRILILRIITMSSTANNKHWMKLMQVEILLCVTKMFVTCS